jgi:hypothetical protein
MLGYIDDADCLLSLPRHQNGERTMINQETSATVVRSDKERRKRRLASLVARCAMGSWVVLAAMPVIVVVCSIA